MGRTPGRAGEVREMLGERFRSCEYIGTVEVGRPSFRLCGQVRRFIAQSCVDANRSSPGLRDLGGCLYQAIRTPAGDVEVAAPAQIEGVAARIRQFFEKIDRPTHERHHGGVRPPVPVALGGLVAGEGQRGARVAENHVAHPLMDRQEVGGADTCDACTANNRVGGSRWCHSQRVPVAGLGSGPRR